MKIKRNRFSAELNAHVILQCRSRFHKLEETLISRAKLRWMKAIVGLFM